MPLGDVMFDYDQSTIRDDQRAALQRNSDYLRRWPSVRVSVEGHADSRGTNEYNLALGERRANAVKEYLVGLGHRRIAFLGGRAEVTSMRLREEAFRRTLTDLRVTVDDDLVVRARPTRDSAYAAAASLFMRRPDLTAIVASSHQLGEAAVLAARELTLRIPADLSVAVIDDVPWAELCDPPLTVVARPARDMGYRACEMLLRTPGRRENRPVVLPTELVVRASCAPVRAVRGAR